MAKHPKGQVPADERDEREDDVVEEEVEVEELVIDPDRPPCPRCGWHNTRLSHTKTIVGTMLKAFSLRAFRCRSCANRFYSKHRVKRG